jgi:hypothetical protein
LRRSIAAKITRSSEVLDSVRGSALPALSDSRTGALAKYMCERFKTQIRSHASENSPAFQCWAI